MSRIVAGVMLVAAQVNYFDRISSVVPTLYAALGLAIVRGLIVGSLWSILLVTIAFALGLGFHVHVDCVVCPPDTEPPSDLTIVRVVMGAVIPITGAALGTALWKLFRRGFPLVRRSLHDGRV